VKGRESPRILVLGHLPPSQGGPATYLSAVLASQLADRFELRPYNIGRPPKPKVHNNIGYSALWNAGPRRMLRAITITLRHLLFFPFELLRFRPAIVHVHTAPYWVFWETAVYVAVCRVCRIPCALQLHYSFRLFYDSCSRLPRRLILRVLRLASVFVVICREDEAFLREIGAVWVRSAYLPNGVAVQDFRSEEREIRRSTEERRGIEVLFLGGSDCRRKGLPELLKAIPRIAAEFPEARFRLIAVPVDLVESALPEELLARCVVEQWVSGRDKAKRLAGADVFVLPTHGEGMPIAILEAMAAGLAIVSTHIAGIPDMIRDGEEGLLIPAGDVEALTEAIVRLFSSTSLRQVLGTKATKRATEEFDMPRCVAHWESLYCSLLGSTIPRNNAPPKAPTGHPKPQSSEATGDPVHRSRQFHQEHRRHPVRCYGLV
jgi:glycosyltransferase involved in cell wall biosynthesis